METVLLWESQGLGRNRLDDECEPRLSIAIVNILVGKKTHGESLLGQC